MVQFRQAVSVIELARDLMAAASETTGVRGTGKILVKSKTAQPVFLQRNWPLMPVINGAAREDLLFKVAKGPFEALYPNGVRKKNVPGEPDAGSWWTVQPGGTVVDIHSVIGGKRHNLKRGTVLTFDPLNPAMKAEVVLQADIVDGADPVHFGGCKSMMQFEQLSGTQATLDAFRAELGKFPGVVIVWDGSQPADGTTQSSTNRGTTRVGTRSQSFKEQFNIFVISERSDSGHLRRSEGLKLLDDITSLISDVQTVDGQVFSSPTGVQVRGRARIAGDNAAYQSVYVYLLQVSLTGSLAPYDSREFNPWLRTHHTQLTDEKDGAGDRKTVVDQDIDMT